MSVGLFTDKSHAPTVTEVLSALGPRQSEWDALVEFLRTRYGGSSDFRFYGKNHGWALRFYKGCHSLASIYPAEESFTVQIILNSALVEQALLLDLGPASRQAIEAANPYPEGRWLLIPIQSEREIEDVRSLLALKFPARRRSAKGSPDS